jgi:hypothetical protein
MLSAEHADNDSIYQTSKLGARYAGSFPRAPACISLKNSRFMLLARERVLGPARNILSG